MPKIDKTQYSKDEWRKIKEQRRLEKAHKPQPALIEIPIKDTSIAFVLGNGISRNSINVEELAQLGSTYGCNALYRTFSPDYLIAVDVKMVLEISKAGYQHQHPVWTNPNKSYANITNLNFFKPSKGWSSGPTALWLASQHQYKHVYILGFDYRGANDGKHFNNIYADTVNYKKSTDGPTFFGNWLRQTATVVKENPNIKFTRVIAQDNYCPAELNKFNNLNTITVEYFIQKFNLS
jgi:hypothetical protein